MRTIQFVLTAVCLGLASAPIVGQEKAKSGENSEVKKGEADDALHKELRAFRAELTEAVKKGDYDKQLEMVTDDVVVMWQDGNAIQGRKALKEFLETNVKKSNIFQRYEKEPEPYKLTVLYGGDTGISYGDSVGIYRLVGQDFPLHNYWTATLVKQDGKWKIASYHVAANVKNNALLNAATQSLYWVGGIALVVGLALGFLIARLMGRPRAA